MVYNFRITAVVFSFVSVEQLNDSAGHRKELDNFTINGVSYNGA